jgi:hypothetical protein
MTTVLGGDREPTLFLNVAKHHLESTLLIQSNELLTRQYKAARKISKTT